MFAGGGASLFISLKIKDAGRCWWMWSLLTKIKDAAHVQMRLLLCFIHGYPPPTFMRIKLIKDPNTVRRLCSDRSHISVKHIAAASPHSIPYHLHTCCCGPAALHSRPPAVQLGHEHMHNIHMQKWKSGTTSAHYTAPADTCCIMRQPEHLT